MFHRLISRVTPAWFVDHEGNGARGRCHHLCHRFRHLISHSTAQTHSRSPPAKIPLTHLRVPRFPFTCEGRDPLLPQPLFLLRALRHLAHGSFFPLIDQWSAYMNKVIRKVQVENIKSLRPRQDAAEQFRQHADAFLQRTAWTGPCRSWFKNGMSDGQVMIYSASRLHFMELLESPKYEDYEIRYWGENRFAFLGNMFTREEDGRDIRY